VRDAMSKRCDVHTVIVYRRWELNFSIIGDSGHESKTANEKRACAPPVDKSLYGISFKMKHVYIE
jgi:hypothetical protein